MQIARTAALVGRLFGSLPTALPAVRGIAATGLAALAFWSPAAHAIVVTSPVANVAVPSTSAGIYINVVSGVTGTSPATASGWDINPWGTGSNFIYAPTGGGIMSATSSPIASLLAGASVGAAATFAPTPGAATFGATPGQWTLNATNYFGFRFVGDDTLTHYGYGSMIVGATATTRTIGQIFYESAGDTAITVSAVPEPASVALLLAGGAGLLLARRRKAG